jgi:hypothetical protein
MNTAKVFLKPLFFFMFTILSNSIVGGEFSYALDFLACPDTHEVHISAPDDCSWLVYYDPFQCATMSPAHGKGSAEAVISIGKNSCQERSCTIRVRGGSCVDKSFPVTQAAGSLSISPPPSSIPACSSPEGYTLAILTEDCGTWAVNTPSSQWPTVPMSHGTGSGETIIFAGENNNGQERSATITVRAMGCSDSFTMTQAAGSLSISPPTSSIPACPPSEGYTLAIATEDCGSWRISDSVIWLAVTPTSGTGSGEAGIYVGENHDGQERSATITVQAMGFTESFTMTQPAACSLSISPTNEQYPPIGGNGYIAVTTQDCCYWSASSSKDWLSITYPDSGIIGNGYVDFSVAANDEGKDRTGTITIIPITGSSMTFTVTQKACRYYLRNSISWLSYDGGTRTITVRADYDSCGCGWQVTNNQHWTNIVGDAYGNGNGVITFTVDPFDPVVDTPPNDYSGVRWGEIQIDRSCLNAGTIGKQRIKQGGPPPGFEATMQLLLLFPIKKD